MSFEYDKFQKQAIELIDQDSSVLVAAPTGAGKTVIAEYAIEQALKKNKPAVYTSPVKALSNQKYRDFYARYGDKIGILTGDVSLNPTAPILIMTTEIYRNSLLEGSDRFTNCDWVIFDEIHYLDDPQRGTVWEEAIVLTPDPVKILSLSATISNAEQIASWMSDLHGRTIQVVRETKRPVPLKVFFQCQGRIMEKEKELHSQGYLGHDSWRDHFKKRRHGRREWLEHRPNRVERLIHHLRKAEHLPCLYFAFGRRRCEILAGEFAAYKFASPEEEKELLDRFDTLVKRYHLEGDATAAEMRHLLSSGVAYHHAGILPTLKEVVEQLFTSRLIKVIVTTETFALGINMPARSVVLDTLRKRTDGGFQVLRSRDYTQMAGRAGRRGLDPEGTVYLRINPLDVDFPALLKVLQSKPEPVLSRLNTAFATLLHLYRHHGEDLLEIYTRTLHYYQSSKKRREEALSLMQRKLDLLRSLGYIEKHQVTPKGIFAASLYGYELTLGELYAAGILEQLDPVALGILLGALIYEPRKGLRPPKRLPKAVRVLTQKCDGTIRAIQKAERTKNIHPRTKPPHFQLSPAIEAWMQGEKFEKLGALCSADDGELVRNFRMMVQILKSLRSAKGTPDKLRQTASQALEWVNRDMVDAEQELRMTLET